MRPHPALLTIALLLLAEPARAQQTPKPSRWSAAAGVSIMTGTPHRPRPESAGELTGAAGPEHGFHVRAGYERRLTPGLLAGGELSYNRLTTSEMTLNCLPGETSYRLSLEASFNATIGRGGGTHHIPILLGVSF